MQHRKYIIGLVLILITTIQLSAVQKDSLDTGKRPKVGLVLSGGGAKGYAHLGALKVIERSGVQIDYVGGTSIGAIVGGLYAAGYSVAEIDSLIRHFDLLKTIRSTPERQYLPYYEKQTEGKTWFRLGFEGFKIRFPSAISNGQGMINLLSEWTIPVHSLSNFAEMYRPFYAKATDLSTGESVKLTSGFLPEAMRASGTFPTLLSPFVINNKLYVDGGVLDNYPIDEMLRQGADIIIGVDINAGLTPTSELSSVISIMDQLIAFQGVKSTKVQIKNLNINITPDISNYSAMSFNAVDSIYVKGVEAAEAKFDDLLAIAQLQQKYPTTPKPVPSMKTEDRYLVTNISIQGNKIYPEEFFLGRFEAHLPSYMPLEDIKNGIDRLYATGNFENIYYRLTKNEKDSNSYTLNIIARENVNKKFIGIGWSYDKLYNARLLLNMKLTDLFGRSVLESDIVIGLNPSLKLNIYRDNGKRPSFGADISIGTLKTSTHLSNVSAYSDGFRLKLNVANQYIIGHAYIQSTIRQQHSIGVGIEYSYRKSFAENFSMGTNKTIYLENSYSLSPYAYLSGDTRDDKFFPTTGSSYDVLYKMIFSPDNNSNEVSPLPSFISANLSHYIKLNNDFSINFDGFIGISLGTRLPYGYKFFPGGIRSTMPFNFVEFYGLPFFWNKNERSESLGIDNFAKAGIKLQYSPAKNQFIYAAYNYGWVGDNHESLGKYSTIQGMGMGYGVSTPIGPFQLTGTYSPNATKGSRWGLYFSAGYSF